MPFLSRPSRQRGSPALRGTVFPEKGLEAAIEYLRDGRYRLLIAGVSMIALF